MRETHFAHWKPALQRHRLYDRAFALAKERQSESPGVVSDYWRQYIAPKQLAPTTLKSYKTRFLKIIYSLIDDPYLDRWSTYDPVEEFESVIHQRELIDNETLCERVLAVNATLTTRTLQLYINFYTNLLGKPLYTIPRHVRLGGDVQVAKRRTREENIVLAESLDHIYRYIKTDVVKLREPAGLIRGALIFLIMFSTCLRINEARKLKLSDMDALIADGQVKTDIKLKRKRSSVSYVKLVEKRGQYLRLAKKIYTRHPNILNLADNTSTPHVDFKKLVMMSNVKDQELTSNSIRHFLASEMYNGGMKPQKISLIMNHTSAINTRRYINSRFHVGPMKGVRGADPPSSSSSSEDGGGGGGGEAVSE